MFAGQRPLMIEQPGPVVAPERLQAIPCMF
jgi:hypothetical protein